MTESKEWQELKEDKDYEININYPHQIRKKSSTKIIKEYEDKDGYLICNIDGKPAKKHRLIALQFIPNPDNLPQIDHKNRIPSDNHISNLRWISNRENCMNRTGYKETKFNYIDELSPEAIVVNHYSKYQFEDLYFHDDKFYSFNGIQYRELSISETITGIKTVRPYDVNGKRITIFYTKFKREYNL